MLQTELDEEGNNNDLAQDLASSGVEGIVSNMPAENQSENNDNSSNTGVPVSKTQECRSANVSHRADDGPLMETSQDPSIVFMKIQPDLSDTSRGVTNVIKEVESLEQ